MKEKHMQTFFGGFLKNTPPGETEIYELKICKGKSLPFSSVKEHQIKALKEASNGSFYHKLTDPPVFGGMNTRFNVKRPFDCECLIKVGAFLVFWFYKPRQPKKFIKVEINDFLKFKKRSTKKSFREDEILEIASDVLEI